MKKVIIFAVANLLVAILQVVLQLIFTEQKKVTNTIMFYI